VKQLKQWFLTRSITNGPRTETGYIGHFRLRPKLCIGRSYTSFCHPYFCAYFQRPHPVIRPRSFHIMDRQPRKRRRPAMSCLECRRRKIKCCRNDPCAHCVSTKAQCTFSIYSNEPRPAPLTTPLNPSTYAPSSLALAQHLSTNRATVEHGIYVPALARSEATNTPENNEIRSPNRISEADPDLRDLLRRVQKLEESASSNHIHGLSETRREILARQSGLQDTQIVLKKTRILRWSDWMGTSQEVLFISMCARRILLITSKVCYYL